jgi:uroporphyrinogen decarboxylase
MLRMTSKERLLAAIAHQEADRVPLSPRMNLWSADLYGTYSWFQQLKLQAEYDMDMLVDVNYELPNYVNYPFSGDYRDLVDVSVEIDVENQGEVNLVKRCFHTPDGILKDVIAFAHPRGKYGISPSPSHKEPLVKTADDVDRIRHLLPNPATFLNVNWREIIGIIGDRGLLQVHPRMMMSGMTAAMGMSESMIGFYKDRDIFDRLLQVYGEYFQKVTRAILEHGAEVVFVSWHNFGVSAGWSPKIYREAFKPWVKANVDLVHEYGAIYNYFDNGPIMPLLEDVAEAGADIISTLCPPPVGDVDLAKTKRLVGNKVCLNGNVDAIWVVQRGTPEQVRDAVREAIHIGAPGGGFILGNSDCFFDQTPRENIDAFFEAAHEFGCYPINV